MLVDWIHEAGRAFAAGTLAGVVFNPGAYTHTSIALHDAIKGTGVPVIELHISNVHARAGVPPSPYLARRARTIVGLGVAGYALAITALASLYRPRRAHGAGASARITSWVCVTTAQSLPASVRTSVCQTCVVRPR